MKNSKVLVTGATGFIAYNLIKELISLGAEVIGLDIVPFIGSRIEKLDVEFFQLDLLNEEKVREVINKTAPDYVVHLAASIERDPKLIGAIVKNNFEMSLNVFNALLDKPIKKIVSIGSADVYGNNAPPFTEETKPMPTSAYGLSKVLISELCSLYSRIHALPIIEIRPFLVYGQGQTNNQFIPYFIKECLKGNEVDLTPGDQTKDFVYVGDLINAIILALESDKTGVYNVCSGKEVKIKDVSSLIKELCKSNSNINFGARPYRKGDGMHFFGSNEKIKRELGWIPKTSLSEGLKIAIAWQKANS